MSLHRFVILPLLFVLPLLTPLSAVAAGHTGMWVSKVEGERYSLFTHCGIPMYIHFQGSWWKLADRTKPAGERTPHMGFNYTVGTMRLIDRWRAAFVFSDGRLRYARLGRTNPITRPCS
jgi:hypothetical protein